MLTRQADESLPRFTPFAYGFRPFFLAALAYAPLAILAWLWMRTEGRLPLHEFPPQLWHGHEMIFGFVGAAISGFLLTAVPSWTGARGFGGAPLIALMTLWLAGRLAFVFAASVPLQALAAADLLFIPALAFLIAPPLLRARNRNTPLLIVLAALWAADATFMYALLHSDAPLATLVLRVSVDVALLLITVIGGRIVPAFTANALRRRAVAVEVRSMRWLEVTVIAAMTLVVAIDVIAPWHRAAAIIAAIAACAHALRLAGWQGLRTLNEPIVWVLHVAYAWLPIGLALKAAFLMSATPWAAHWLHALTLGTIGMMVVAVITRASLGHTGRALVVSRPVAAAYGLLAISAVVRVWASAIFASHYEWVLRISGGLWIAAFALLVTVYAPILLQPRIDGRPG